MQLRAEEDRRVNEKSRREERVRYEDYENAAEWIKRISAHPTFHYLPVRLARPSDSKHARTTGLARYVN